MAQSFACPGLLGEYKGGDRAVNALTNEEMLANMGVRSSRTGPVPKEFLISGATAPLANQGVEIVRGYRYLEGVKQVVGPQPPAQWLPPLPHLFGEHFVCCPSAFFCVVHGEF